MKSVDIGLLHSLFVLCVLAPVSCSQNKYCNPLQTHHPHQRGVCGTSLADMLSLVCMYNGGFNSMDFKRSGTKVDQTEGHKPKDTSTEQLRDLLLSRRSAFQFLVQKKSSSGDGIGVVCECCYHACKISEMKQYCAFDSDYYDGFMKRDEGDDSSEDSVNVEE